MTHAPVKPSLIAWARERAGLESADLAHRFPKLEAWEAGETQPTLRQVKAFARAVHVPVGYLFLSELPEEEPLPIPDFRTMAEQPVPQASLDLRDTIYMARERQGWYREFALMTGEPEARFVGSLTTKTPVRKAAADMAEVLGFDLAALADCPTWVDALRLFTHQAEQAGVLVMVSGVVRGNNHRPLNPDEFRGFALADAHAPLVFINGKDTKAGQMFTLAHELAHLWLGISALSDASAAPINSDQREEVWCHAVAAKLLAPLDAGVLKCSEFEVAWQTEPPNHLVPVADDTAGRGDFYSITLSRVGRRFARALVASTLEGKTFYRDAFRMLGVKKTKTFNEIGRKMGL